MVVFVMIACKTEDICCRPRFRSYRPQDESLLEAKLEDALPPAVEDEVKDLLEAGKEKVII